MREIKFRAWDGEKFLYFGITSLIVDAVEGDVRELYSLLRTGNFQPDRYTGLKDRNGAEIYEGDLVTTFPEGSPNRDYPREVVWSDVFHAFVLEWHGQSVGWDSEEQEVIGNIYENPELLEQAS